MLVDSTAPALNALQSLCCRVSRTLSVPWRMLMVALAGYIIKICPDCLQGICRNQIEFRRGHVIQMHKTLIRRRHRALSIRWSATVLIKILARWSCPVIAHPTSAAASRPDAVTTPSRRSTRTERKAAAGVGHYLQRAVAFHAGFAELS